MNIRDYATLHLDTN